jgi:LacI family transcriptional regulator
MTPAPNLRTIAARAGVSHTTVSLALRGDRRLPAATRKRIEAIARKLGYRRDAALGALMAKLRTIRARPAQEALGFVTAWPTRNGWRAAANHRRFHAGALERARELGYSLDEFWLAEPGMTPARMTRILLTRGIRGLILHSLPHPEGEIVLGWKQFAAVAKGVTIARPSLHRVISSHYDDIRLVARELTRRNYERIGLVLGAELNDRVDCAWLAGLHVHQRTLPRSSRIPPLILGAGDGAGMFARWFKRFRPDAVLFSDQPVPGWLAPLDVLAPRDLGLVHLDWSPELAPLAGLDSDAEALGRAAVDLLVGQLHAQEFGIPRHEKIITIKGRWQEGPSVRPVGRRRGAAAG